MLPGLDVTGPGPSLEKIGLSDSLLDGAGAALRRLVDELENRGGRPADAGDLLVLLASVREGIGERTLAALGIDADALARRVDETRGTSVRSSLLPPQEVLAECEQIRAERLTAIQAGGYGAARELRDRERALLEEALEPLEARQQEFLSQLRVRLGLAKP